MLATIESRFGVSMRQIVESQGGEEVAKANPLLKLVIEHPSLWPYYLFPPQGQEFVPPLGSLDEPKVQVRVNHGSWQTLCPFCPSAQHASKTDHWFFCAGCCNAAVGCKAVPVVWPRNVAKIEGLLLERPFVPTQNWEPGESTTLLRAENETFLS